MLSARDMAKFGYLYLRNGQWQDKSILSSEYIRASMASNTSSNFSQYGFMWWLFDEGCFSASGWGGQTIAAFPKHDIVVVIQGNHMCGRGEGFDSLIGDIVIPAIEE